jgi:hypothetical protein
MLVFSGVYISLYNSGIATSSDLENRKGTFRPTRLPIRARIGPGPRRVLPTTSTPLCSFLFFVVSHS